MNSEILAAIRAAQEAEDNLLGTLEVEYFNVPTADRRGLAQEQMDTLARRNRLRQLVENAARSNLVGPIVETVGPS